MNKGEDSSTDSDIKPIEQKHGRKRRVIIPMVAALGVIVLASSLAVWEPWKDRSPFTVFDLGMQEAKYTFPGSAPNSCIRDGASEQETVLFSTDGERLAAGRAQREGILLGPEFGAWAGFCAITTRIDGVPGGYGTYLSEWGRGERREVEEEDLRRSLDERLEALKTSKGPEK
ncbi:hypothetical protein ACFYVL_14160 [Streptomyces sp. NPDC004111]|uniref:hypothetical protein n=1 Tax=Streptomyces sp. NPDC004111 TaxID=3364690 RepID=UPI0036B04472